MGTFQSIWDMVISGVEYASAPTERWVDDGEKKETPEFAKPIGENFTLSQGICANLIMKTSSML